MHAASEVAYIAAIVSLLRGAGRHLYVLTFRPHHSHRPTLLTSASLPPNTWLHFVKMVAFRCKSLLHPSSSVRTSFTCLLPLLRARLCLLRSANPPRGRGSDLLDGASLAIRCLLLNSPRKIAAAAGICSSCPHFVSRLELRQAHPSDRSAFAKMGSVADLR